MTQSRVRPGLYRPVSEFLRYSQDVLVISHRLSEVSSVMMRRSQVAEGPRLLHAVSESSGYPEVLRVTIDGALELTHGQVDRPDVTDLPSFLKPIAHLLHQLHALLVGGQGIRQIADRRVNVAQAGQRRRRRLSVLALHRQNKLIPVSR